MSQLTGTWDIESYVVVGCDDPRNNWTGENGLIDCFDEDDLNVCYSMTFTFSQNGAASSTITTVITSDSGQSQTFSETVSFTFTVNGDEITLCSEDDLQDCNTVSFVLEDNSITMRDTGDNSNCQTTFSGTKRP